MIRKAQRSKAKLKIGVSGPSGSGKTYSALLLGNGLTSWDKIVVIDTERHSADLYCHLGDYSVRELEKPFEPKKYIEAIEECEKAGFDVIIIDSITHEWDGVGGCLDIHTKLSTGKNSFTAWGQVTPLHNAFIDKILQSNCHIICTMRAKQDYVLVDKNGRQVPEKVGLKAITREGFDYEVTLSFDLDINHNAIASKDRTSLFDSKTPFTISQETGNLLLQWANSGSDNNKNGTVLTNKDTAPVDVSTNTKQGAVSNGFNTSKDTEKKPENQPKTHPAKSKGKLTIEDLLNMDYLQFQAKIEGYSLEGLQGAAKASCKHLKIDYMQLTKDLLGQSPPFTDKQLVKVLNRLYNENKKQIEALDKQIEQQAAEFEKENELTDDEINLKIRADHLWKELHAVLKPKQKTNLKDDMVYTFNADHPDKVDKGLYDKLVLYLQKRVDNISSGQELFADDDNENVETDDVDLNAVDKLF